MSLVSCLYCREVKSTKGLFVHVDRTHLKLSKYSNGNNGKYGLLRNRAIEKRNAFICEYDKNPNKCKYCHNILSFDKRLQKFCNQSCAAFYTNASKDWSKIKTGPSKKEKVLLIKSCSTCNKEIKTFRKTKIFCSQRCINKHKFNIKLQTNTISLLEYRTEAKFRFSLKDYPDEFDFSLIENHGWYKAKNRGNNLYGVSRDHMVSVKYGYENNIPPEHIAHPANCRLVLHSDNVSKGCKNYITYQELLEKISRWKEKYSKF